MQEILLAIIAAMGVACLALLCLLLAGEKRRRQQAEEQARKAAEEQLLKTREELRLLRQELAGNIQQSVAAMGGLLRENQQQAAKNQDQRIVDLSENLHRSISLMSAALKESQQQSAQKQDQRIADLSGQLALRQEALQTFLGESLRKQEARMNGFSMENEQRLEQIRRTMQEQLGQLRQENNQKLDEMRSTVDEKLQKTLEERIGQSFKLVSDRLEQVYKGLGEMQSLAAGVGDLKKVLSNVKTRGILGEIQLGAILEQVLAPEQYDSNVATRPGSSCVVEYAVRLPGDGETPVYLPIDAKFPADAYSALLDAYDLGGTEKINQAGKELESRIKGFAKDISEKYIEPPFTTDFAIMFLPVEGLYAEAVRRNLVEVLQREYKVNIAGPTTMAALLNSLQMGFKTLAIQKRSGEVWRVLGAVKTEFDKFGGAIEAAQKRLEQAGSELDKLVGVRTRQIQKRLRTVAALPESESAQLLETAEEEESEAE